MEKENCLTLRGITKTYPDGKQALKGISLSLTPGIYGLLGPNGAGKSTLMKLIAYGMPPTSGEITYNGEPIRRMGREYRKFIGYMPQQQGLLEGFTGRRFLWYMASLKGMKRQEADRQIGQLLKVVNLEKAADSRIGGYSGGMKQRLLLAQALLDNPRILILDEPTAGLDPRERVRIRNFISRIASNRIVLIATHVVSDIECIAGQVLLLKEGKLIKSGPPEELLRSVSGAVWEKTIAREKLPSVERRVCVSNVLLQDEGYRVRIVSDVRYKGWTMADPTLEDVYLYYFA